MSLFNVNGNHRRVVARALIGMSLSAPVSRDATAQAPDKPAQQGAATRPNGATTQLPTVAPVISITLNNPSRTKLNIVEWSDFNPPTAKTGAPFDPRQLRVANVVASKPILNLRGTVCLDDPKTPETHEGFQSLASYIQNEYLPKHPQLLQKLGISDITRLSPREGILLASSITMNHLRYSGAQAANDEESLNDSMSIEQVLRWEEGESGNGVCRNYCALVKGIFEAVKLLQSSRALDSTFLLYLSDYRPPVGEPTIPGDVGNHAWSAAVTFTDAEAVCAILDLTWSDKPTVHGEIPELKNFSDARAFTVLDFMRSNGLIESREMARQITQFYSSAEPLKASDFDQVRMVPRYGVMPLRMQCADWLLQYALRDKSFLNEAKVSLRQIGLEQADNLQCYLSAANNFQERFSSSSLEKMMLLPMVKAAVTNARVACALEDDATLAKLAEFRKELSKAGIEAPIERALSEAELAYQLRNSRDTRDIVDFYRAQLPGFDSVVQDPLPGKFFEALGNRLSGREKQLLDDSLRKAQLIKKQPHPSHELRHDVREHLDSLIHAKGLEDIKILVLTDPSIKDVFDEATLSVPWNASFVEVEQRVDRLVSARLILKEIRRVCPAHLTPVNFFKGTAVGDEEPLLRNIGRYLSDPAKVPLLKHRSVSICDIESKERFSDPFSDVVIPPALFKDGGYDPKVIDAILSKNDRDKRLAESDRLGLERKFRDSFPITVENDAEPPLRAKQVYSHLATLIEEHLFQTKGSHTRPLTIVIADATSGTPISRNQGALLGKGHERATVDPLRQGEKLIPKQPAIYYNPVGDILRIDPDAQFEQLKSGFKEALHIRSVVTSFTHEVQSSIGGKLTFSSDTLFLDGSGPRYAQVGVEMDKIRQLISFLRQNPDYKDGALSTFHVRIEQPELSVEIDQAPSVSGRAYRSLQLDSVPAAQRELAAVMRAVSLCKEIRGKAKSLVDPRGLLTSMLEVNADKLSDVVVLLEEISKRVRRDKGSSFTIETKYESFDEEVDDHAKEYFFVRIDEENRVIQFVWKKLFDLELLQ